VPAMCTRIEVVIDSIVSLLNGEPLRLALNISTTAHIGSFCVPAQDLLQASAAACGIADMLAEVASSGSDAVTAAVSGSDDELTRLQLVALERLAPALNVLPVAVDLFTPVIRTLRQMLLGLGSSIGSVLHGSLHGVRQAIDGEMKASAEDSGLIADNVAFVSEPLRMDGPEQLADALSAVCNKLRNVQSAGTELLLASLMVLCGAVICRYSLGNYLAVIHVKWLKQRVRIETVWLFSSQLSTNRIDPSVELHKPSPSVASVKDKLTQ